MRKCSIAVMGWTLWDGRDKTPNGAAVVTYELTKRLSKYFDCDMIFETSDREKAGKVEETSEGFQKRFIHRMREPWLLDEEFLRDYDMIHIWDSFPIFTYRAFTRRILPHCYTLHSAVSMMNWIGLASAFYIPEYDLITLGSRCLADALNRFWNTPVSIIPYGVDIDFFKPMDKNDCRESLKIPRDSIVLGYLGRISKLDINLAYDTLRKVKKRLCREDIIFVAAGGRRKKVKPVRVKDDFIYLGYLERYELPFFLNSCDIFFNPAVGAREGFGLTVIEAMSCGLPIVTASWNGYSETVSPNTGFRARTCWKNGDVWINQEDLVSACMELVRNEDLREEMGKRARRRAEKYYCWERCVEKYRLSFLNLMRRTSPEKFQSRLQPDEITIRMKGKEILISIREAL
ncbi:TPA: glycosyltransferase family 1 protein, partial [Candidatus Bathyarchaeota archaeon]|nr:glycosyltransferase family 1 protein [Candidatus Bathyarchaeota archaeon]